MFSYGLSPNIHGSLIFPNYNEEIAEELKDHIKEKTMILMSNVPDVIPGEHLSTVVYRKVPFGQLSIPFTFDGAHSLYRSFGAWPEIAKI